MGRGEDAGTTGMGRAAAIEGGKLHAHARQQPRPLCSRREPTQAGRRGRRLNTRAARGARKLSTAPAVCGFTTRRTARGT